MTNEAKVSGHNSTGLSDAFQACEQTFLHRLMDALVENLVEADFQRY